MSKLPYTNDLQLIDAFKNGTKFAIRIPGKPDATVLSIYENRAGGLSVVYQRPGYATPSHSRNFTFDGTNVTNERTLVEAPAEAAPALTMAPDYAPFLKRFVNGEPAYSPATREVVIGVSFVKGAIEVLLKAEDGTERVSTRYDHEGRHRWVTARSLVFGNLPPKKTKVELRIYLENFYGNRRYVTLEKDQVLPSNGRHHKLVSTVEIEV